ncbi:MAG: hypothetical protein AAB532_03350 [Patescibacteria group bacterium]|mgnify:CR=1 FL=1
MIKEIIRIRCAKNSIEFNLLIPRAERNVLLEGKRDFAMGFERREVKQRFRFSRGLQLDNSMPISTRQVIPSTSTVRLGQGHLRT